MKKTPSWNRRFKGWPKSEELPQTEDEARTFLEAIRWPNGPVCPHCGSTRITRLSGTSAAAGRIQCNGCRKQFTVTVGTQWHRSHLTLVQRLRAISVCVLNKDVPITQLQKDLGIGSYRSALRLKKTVLQVLEEWSATPEARKVGPDYVAMHRDDEMRKVFRDFIDFYSKQFLPNHPSFAATEFLSEYRAHLDDEHKMVFDDAVTGTNTGKDLMPRYRYRAAKEIYRHIFEFSIKKIGEIG